MSFQECLFIQFGELISGIYDILFNLIQSTCYYTEKSAMQNNVLRNSSQRTVQYVK